MLRIIAIAILVYVGIRFVLRIFGLGGSKNNDGPGNRGQRKQQRQKHREGDVIIEYKKPPQKRPRLDADDVEYEVIE